MKNLLEKRPLSEQFAEAVANILKEIILIIIGGLVIIGKLLWKFRQAEWKLTLILIGAYLVFGNLPSYAKAPRNVQALIVPFVKPAVKPYTPPTHEEIVLAAKHGDIIVRIWNNETSKGTNINMSDKTDLAAYCKAKGMTNEFGFNPYNHQCFRTFEESVQRVSTWWDDCLTTRSLSQCLKRYSGNSESYVERFINQ